MEAGKTFEERRERRAAEMFEKAATHAGSRPLEKKKTSLEDLRHAWKRPGPDKIKTLIDSGTEAGT